jgi:hypothetical protein
MTNHIISIKQALRANKLVESFTTFCVNGGVCSRGTVYNCLNPNTYDHSSFIHRSIVRLAINYLKDREVNAGVFVSEFPETLPTAA